MYSDGEKTVAKAMFVEMILIIPLFFELLLCRFFFPIIKLYFNLTHEQPHKQVHVCIKCSSFFSNFKSIVRNMAYWSRSQIARLYRNIQLNEFAFR